MARKKIEKKVDKGVEMTFPASDPVAVGGTTSTEPPARPTDRKAPIISKEDVERAEKGGDGGHRKRAGKVAAQCKPARGDEAAPGTPGTGEDVCPQCHGTGRLHERTCAHCEGTGRITKAIGGA